MQLTLYGIHSQWLSMRSRTVVFMSFWNNQNWNNPTISLLHSSLLACASVVYCFLRNKFFYMPGKYDFTKMHKHKHSQGHKGTMTPFIR